MNFMGKLGWLIRCGLVLAGGVFTMAPSPCNLRIAEYPGSSDKAGREGTSDIFAVDHELVQPIDSSTGLPTGVHQHRAFTVLKKIDKASPGLHKAFATGQNLNTAVLDFYRADTTTGLEVKYYTVTLKNVRIIGIKTLVPTSFLPENQTFGHMEEVRMVYENIEWKWLPDNLIESDSWDASGSRASLQSAAQTNLPAAGLPPGINSLGGSKPGATSAASSQTTKPARPDAEAK